MINSKKLYKTILNDTRVTTLVKKVVDAYPNKVEIFPCVVYIDDTQTDKEFADNKPQATRCGVTIHVFTKALSGYATTTEIGLVINDIMHENDFACISNGETPDVSDDVRHRVMVFDRDFLS